MKRVLKSRLGAALFATRLYRLRLRNRASVVLFHRVDDRLRGSPLACSTKDFRAYCAFFARHFHVITLGELLRRMRTGASLSRCLVITFDDGYEDNYLFAAPVLREHGLTACFFITSEFIGSSIRPVWDREYGVPSPWMSWEQVASLREQGFEIGAHTMTHPSLARVSHDRVVAEVFGSKQRIERELGGSQAFFSYPFGGTEHMTEDARTIVRWAGYDCCLSGCAGTITAETDPFRLPRFAVTPWHRSTGQFGFEMLLPDSRLASPAAEPSKKPLLGESERAVAPTVKPLKVLLAQATVSGQRQHVRREEPRPRERVLVVGADGSEQWEFAEGVRIAGRDAEPEGRGIDDSAGGAAREHRQSQEPGYSG